MDVGTPGCRHSLLPLHRDPLTYPNADTADTVWELPMVWRLSLRALRLQLLPVHCCCRYGVTPAFYERPCVFFFHLFRFTTVPDNGLPEHLRDFNFFLSGEKHAPVSAVSQIRPVF